MRRKAISSTNSRPHSLGVASVQSEATAVENEAKTPPPHFISFIYQHRSEAGRFGDLARSVFRDPCFPRPSEASYVACVAHVNEVHGGKPDVLQALEEMYIIWTTAWTATGTRPYAAMGQRHEFPPRPDICAVAVEMNIHTKHGGRFCKAICPYHSGEGEPSLVLWRDNNMFRCESPRCFVWGFSDQLRASKFQGIHN